MLMTTDESPTKHIDSRYIFVLSAKDSKRLLEQVRRMLTFFEKKGYRGKDIRNICYTLQTGREMMESRLAFLVSSIEELKIKLEEYMEGYTKVEVMYLGEGDVDTQQVIKRRFPYETDYKADINSLIDGRNYEELCEVWAKGISIDWDRLYEGSIPAPRIMSLPSYSFESKEYWAPSKLSEYKTVKETSKKHQESEIVNTVSKSPIHEKKEDDEPYETLLYEEIWTETAYKAKLHAGKNDKIVCFLSEKKVQEKLKKSDLGLEFIFVEAGGFFEKSDRNHYRILPEDSESYLNCLKSIAHDFGTINGIFYFWSIENLRQENKFFYDAIRIIMKGFSNVGLKPGHLLLAGGYSSALERCYAESLIGFERSVSMILPETVIRAICTKSEENNMDLWISYFLSEYQADCNKSVLYENGVRKCLSYVYTDIKENRISKIQREGVYLITGGVGGLGTIFAKFLLKKYNAKLILTGRSDIESQKKKLKELEAYGKDILYVQADVCEYYQMQTAVEQGRSHFGHIDGVIHAAGIEGKGSVLTKTTEEFNKVLAPKINGTVSLLKAIENENVDFVCLFSSSSAILGDFGSCDYAIGNRFLMAAAGYMFKNATVVNWPLWKDGGMGINDIESNKMYLKSSGQMFLDTEAGTALFEKIVNSGIQQVMAIIGKKSKVSRFIKTEEKKVSLKERDEVMKVSGNIIDKRRSAKMSGWSLEDCVLWELKAATEQILEIPKDQMEADDNLADFGYDSISLAEFANALTEKLGLEITPDIFFSYPTLGRLCKFILLTYNDEMESLYSIEEVASEIYTDTESESKSKIEAIYDGNVVHNENNEKVQSVKSTDKVAIVGLSGRFPEAQNIDELWDILEHGREVIKKVPSERKEWLKNDGIKSHDYRMGVLSGIDEFDPLFFEISPLEAENMDPQQRLLLQEIWKALEDAGYGTKLFENEKIGVFVGAEDSDYKHIGPNDGSITTNNMSMLSGRIAYFLDLKGPNMSLNTACSSGLMAVHQACLSILSGECDTAIAAGINITTTSLAYDGMELAGMLSVDRRCYAFDSRANGMVPAESVAVVVLKRMSKALKDKNRIYATVVGSGTNYDGKTNGITAPRGESQKELLKSIYDRYQINPENISYIVAHGTGTRLGDPIELNALADTFSEYTTKKQFCAVGSVKANFGHALSASGTVSLISLVSAMQKETIPKQINCEKESDYIKWDKSPFYINRSNQEWKDEEGHRRLGAVSSFGMSGSNVHVVVENYPKAEAMKETHPCSLLVLSAKTEQALERKCVDFAQMLEDGNDDATLSDISYTLLEGRKHFNYRIAILAGDKKEAAGMLKRLKESQKQPNIYRNQVKRGFKVLSGICDIIKDSAMKCAFERNTAEYRKLLEVFAEFYCQGYEINGDLLFSGEKIRRVKLPLYPFLKEKYWKNGSDISTLATDGLNVHKTTKEDLEDKSETLYVEETWEPNPLILHGEKAEGVILWFLSEEENISSVDYYISKDGLNINPVYISQGDAFALKSHGRYVIDSEKEQDFKKLFSHLADTYGNINGIMYMWATEERCSLRNGEDIVNILKGIHENGLAPAKILMAGLVENGLERSFMESLIGFQRSTGMILPKTELKFVAGNAEGYTCTDFISVVLKEYCLSDLESVFYENGTRKTLSLLRVNTEKSREAVIKPGGVYLVTGGLGGIGFIVSKWLLSSHNAKIVLTGRSLNDEKEEKLKKLKEYENDVLYYQADVCDKEQMQYVVNEAKRQFGTIDGVIHAAGIGGKGSILEKDLNEYKEILAPKVQGTIVLDEVLKHEKLDFICYFSSVAAILGDFGSCEYSVGNRFMMSFAQELDRRKPEGRYYKKAVVINWPLWQDGGMGLEDEKRTLMYMKASGQRLLQSDEAMKYLELLLCQKRPQHMILVGRSDRLKHIISKKNNMAQSEEGRQEVIKQSKEVVKQRKSAVNKKVLSFEDMKDLVLENLGSLASQMMKIPVMQLDYDAVLAEFGFDSITLSKYADVLNEHYDVLITPDVFYSYPTLLNLSAYFMSNHLEEVEKLYKKEDDTVEVEIMDESDIKPASMLVSEIVPERVQGRLPEEILTNHDSIAIIGVSGRFPDAENVEELWKILAEGRNAIHEAYSDREPWHMDDKVRKFGSIPGIAEFDPLFFEISPSEAENMDPRQRLLLQEAWNALENAGYGQKLLEEENIGVFVGAEDGDYRDLTGKEGNITSNHNAIMSARIAYMLNMGGPNMSINTACSSGLLALHEACLSIKSGECDTAVVAGINLITEPSGYDKMSEAGMLSETQTCYAFDRRANGMVPSEAIAVVILKRMSKAVKDKNPILASIVGSGTNYDGKTNGITAPSGQAQTRLLKSIYKKHHINPESISYIVTHGTGTRLGDPIEMNALVDVFDEYTTKKQFCAVGSVKANIGHSLAASGVVSLISLVTAMQKETIPGQINCEMESDYIKWDKSSFYINRSNQEWKDEKGHRRMGAVSSFGMSGTNVHVVVESYPKIQPAQQIYPYSLLILSAKTEEALERKCEDLAQMLEDENNNATLSDISYTLLEGRKHFNCRIAIIARDRKEVAGMLRRMQENQNQANFYRNLVKRNFKAQAGISDIVKDLAVKCAAERDAMEYKKMLGAFAEFYCQGYEINGDLLFAGANVCRIKVPLYPFLKEKYWRQSKNGTGISTLAEDGSSIHRTAKEDLGDKSETLYVEETWEPAPLTLDREKAEGVILWFLSEEENISAVDKYISREGLNINPVYVSQGNAFTVRSHGRYIIDSKKEQEFEKLFSHLADTYGNINGIMYMWSTEEICSLRNGEDIVNILKGIYKNGLTPAKILMAGLSENGLERSFMESLIGFQRSTGMVLTKTKLKFVAGNAEYYTCIDFISVAMEEYCLSDLESVFYENGTRKTLSLGKVKTEESRESAFKPGGVYLITGGLGAIGFIVSKWILSSHNAKIVLTGRSLNEVKEEKLKKLKEYGNDVLYYQADVCDKEQMQYVVKEAKKQFGTIDGVIHAAGVGGKGSILEKELSEYEMVLAPKVQGTIVLDEVLKDEKLDFICYFSSTSAILGDFGSCEYSVGNRFMMSFAQELYRRKPEERYYKKVVVINWPLWKDGGMGLDEENRTLMYMKTSGQRLLQSDEAMKYFELLLCQNRPQHMILVGRNDRINSIISKKKNIAQNKQNKKEIVNQSKNAINKKVLSSGYIKKLMLKDLQCLAGELLKISIEKLDYDAVMSEFGFDSMTLSEYADILNEHYNILITPDVFYSYPTLLDLSDYFMSHHLEEIERLYKKQDDTVEVEIMPESDIQQVSKPASERVAERVPEENLTSQDSIAIIGVSGRFPDAKNVEELWKILAEGRNAIHEVGSDRESWHMDDKVRKFGSIQGIAEFDPLFFEIPPSEAENMDPRQRLLLQEAWNALERAGYGQKLIEGENIGVFVGAEDSSYQDLTGKEGNITSNHNAIMSARLAYLLNMGGPNMSINTACSSGLSAVHEACLSIKNGECDTAVVAGVNLIIEPGAYDKMSEAGMLSETQTCYAFDRRADGMVPAEAVAVVILKRMSKAVKDKNPILATIVGGGINYDGKTNGITAPSGQAQTRLLKSVYKKHHINPENISYIVAHGTGTRLGDPIEMNALVGAFDEYTTKKQFCAVGSVKANIGHSLAASGVVSLISLVTAMQKEIIPGQINCEMESDYIKWDKSPFYINRSNSEWKDEQGRRRMGAVSSFGMSGTNVHVVVESYPKAEPTQEKYPYSLLVLSARTEKALERKCSDLAQMLENDNDDVTLSDISYTLLEGRKHFNYRCALVVSDHKEAAWMLRNISKEQTCVFKDKVKRNFIALDEEKDIIRSMEEKYASEKDASECKKILCSLARDYCNAYEVDGDILFTEKNVHLIILPSYPYSKEKYWANPKDDSTNSALINVIHPMIGKNISDFTKQKYYAVFTGGEPFFKDHIIGGKKTLPGVAYLEMARTAAEDAAGTLWGKGRNVRISKIGWFSPITSTKENLEVRIGLEIQADNTLSYEIYTQIGEENSVHSQGSVEFVQCAKPDKEDIEALKRNSTVSISGEDCYQLYSKLGMEYGESFRCIHQMFLCGDRILAKLQMPDNTTMPCDRYVLHPGMMDAGLQTTVGFAFVDGMTENINTSIPFALDEVTVYDRCAEEMWAVVSYNPSGEKISKYDVNLCDASGNVCVQIKGYTSRETKQNEIGKAILLERKRKLSKLSASKEVQAEATTVYIGMKNPPKNEITIDVPEIDDVQGLDIAYRDAATSVFEIIKGMMTRKQEEDKILQVIIPNDVTGRIYGSISGMLKTANHEKPTITTKIIEADADETSEALLRIANAEINDTKDNYVIYLNNARYTENFCRMERSSGSSMPWKDGGVYLITGGAGGLGRIFAKEIGQKTVGSTIIITGRYEENERTSAAIEEIEEAGASAVYYRVDVTDLQAIEDVLEKIVSVYGHIDGIIHSAGIVKDNYIIKKTKEEFQEVLEPKVTGTVGLDIATENMKLDFMIYFSSVTGELGNSGQSDYAAANAFMDNYAHYRNNLVSKGLRSGRTMSVNWPQWKDGGMYIDPGTEEILNRRMGILLMPVQTGIQVLYNGWCKGVEEIICLYGENGRIDNLVDDLCKEKIIIDES